MTLSYCHWILQALNTLGNTKWRINKKVLGVAESLWASGVNIAGLFNCEDVRTGLYLYEVFYTYCWCLFRFLVLQKYSGRRPLEVRAYLIFCYSGFAPNLFYHLVHSSTWICMLSGFVTRNASDRGSSRTSCMGREYEEGKKNQSGATCFTMSHWT